MSAFVAALLQLAMAAGPVGVDLAGHSVDRLDLSGKRAVVLFFTATDCPIANRYVPAIERLAKENGDAAVWFVYPNPGDSAEAVRAHQARFSISGNVVLDTQHTLTRMAHATVTPEAAVFVAEKAGLREVYRGRIDDRYAGLGKERPQAMHHDLEDALAAVLAGRAVPGPGGPPVGCAIMPLEQAPAGR